MDLKTAATRYLVELQQKWLMLQNTDNVFAYNLNVTKSRYLPGQKIIYMEYNPQRTRLRRLPQTISSLKPVFNEEAFNFKKIKPLELLMSIPYEDIVISMIINKSPLTRYHTLVCPDVAAGQPQRLTLPALSFCVKFLLNLADEEKAFRIGYNSPGALASVNHLHLHILYVTADLYVDKAELELLQSTNIYRLSDKMPTEAICFIFNKTTDEAALNAQIQKLFNFIIWLCEHDIPHNLFLTPNRSACFGNVLKVFVSCRKAFCYVKDLNTYNIGFCEVSGYVTVGDEQLYESLTEQEVLAKIQSETGEVYKEIYEYFKA
ncbi:GDP-D-glucose phosphorylase 1 [Zeugodacus cucurbitae]|uniref:GDP-D-glucose phosphorylase 1 n=1 Tax=Zeugodacus cucurbitae TaxID=28588 RepID=UPI000596A681|nr:GDP-D-glucose phosphorylase 1 [Zeugodacus cucurbitae]XP_011195806.1 GDP-D-glucose phosphorylase 1 [Zeugodacus cucurbitae]